MTPTWLIYEDAARKVLADLRNALGLDSVEGKQVLDGASGAKWEIDAKAWRKGSEKFLVVEARRHTKSRLKQKDIAAIAFQIQDVGGTGAVVVSPLPMQQGAKVISASANIQHVRLSSDSTADSYLAEYMGRRFLGATTAETVIASDTLDAVIRPKKSGA